MRISFLGHNFHFGLVSTLVTLLAIVVLVKLGFWQLSRAEAKELRLVQIEQRQSTNPFSVEELKSKLSLGESVADYPMAITGEFDNKKYYLLDNRIFNGKVGYEVIKLFNDQSGNKLLVNMGWVGIERSRQELPVIEPVKGVITITGKSYEPEPEPFKLAETEFSAGWPQVIQFIEMSPLQHHMGEQMLPFILQLGEKEEVGFPRKWKAVVMPPQKHYGYAMQWFGLAIACVVIFLFATREQQEENNE